MFEIDDRPGCVIGLLPSALRYAFQLLLCYPVTLLASLPLSLVLSKVGLSGEHQSQIYFGGYDALLYLFIAPIVGWGAGRLAPSLVSTGRWIWAAPVIVVLWDIVGEEFRPQSVPWPPEYLFAIGEGLGVYLFTLPACSAAGYSIGMAFVGISRRWGRLTQSHIVALGLAGVLLFSLLAALMHNLERAKLDSWNRLRTVIDHSGLPFSHDAGLLCANPTNPPGSILLADWTTAESLERRACKGGRLLDLDKEATPDAFILERVRVLTGPHAGLEGWVCAYGLREH
jgi:hypothetical protein